MSEQERKAAFAANPMAESFLATLLQDAQLSENDSACVEEREPMDSGTIYDCPDSTFNLAMRECQRFRDAITQAIVTVPDGALAGLDTDCRYTLEAIGSDLYLERAGHGAGFRDRDIWSDDSDECRAIGEALSDLVERGAVESYFGDDGKLYASGYVHGRRGE